MVLFRNEINDSIRLLQEGRLEPLPYDGWTLTVNSGDLRLFSSDKVNELRVAYTGIQKYNYGLEWVRRTIERSKPMIKNRKQLHKRLDAIETKLVFDQHATELLSALQVLANKDWFRDP